MCEQSLDRQTATSEIGPTAKFDAPLRRSACQGRLEAAGPWPDRPDCLIVEVVGFKGERPKPSYRSVTHLDAGRISAFN
jgi:hypothetical protein